jgi:hypothetical protein
VRHIVQDDGTFGRMCSLFEVSLHAGLVWTRV